jgi:hypothetical protein
MGFYEDYLLPGSKFHTAEPVTGGLQITVAEVSDDECLRGFQGVIDEAENHGYEVTHKHSYTQRGLPGWLGPIYDTAVVLRC